MRVVACRSLRCAEIVGVVEELEEADMLDCLRLLHFHVGSQVPTSHVHEIPPTSRDAVRWWCHVHGRCTSRLFRHFRPPLLS